MKFPDVDVATWRAQVEKELAGASFEKALVHVTPEGIAIQPLYTEAPPTGAPVPEGSSAPFRICVRHAATDDPADDLDGGADALWVELATGGEIERVVARIEPMRTFLAINTDDPLDVLDRLAKHPDVAFALASTAPVDPAGIVETARRTATLRNGSTAVTVSSLDVHDAGADAADELAVLLSEGAWVLRTLLDAGAPANEAASQLSLRVAVGRDTFGELCKLRALRVVWRKLLGACGVTDAPPTRVHAVCSSRTLTQRDPWVNLLRTTTQVFSAVLGGAELVTPTAFDAALGPPLPLARRIARNIGLVLRDESALGRVIDPAGGSYYLETLTDALAREAWRRFQRFEREGGVRDARKRGRLQAQLETAWTKRLAQIATRKIPIVGVSEFANLDEKLPHTIAAEADPGGGLPVHREAEAFERLRTRVERAGPSPEVALSTLGTVAESRARVGFAIGFFAAGGLRARETTDVAPIACLCGTDERYAAEAVERARSLKAAGCTRVLVAGRPGALEPALRAAGVDGFLFVGCDVIATLTELLDGLR